MLRLLVLGLATQAWIDGNAKDGGVYFWPTKRGEDEDEDGEGEGTWTLLGSEWGAADGSMRSYTVRASDFEQKRWWDDPKIKDALAAVEALRHIEKHDLHTVCRGFIHPDPAGTKPLPTEQRGLSRQFFIDFARAFKLPEDMPVLVVLHMVR